MSKSEIFNTILRMVSEETEIPSAQILSGRKDTETVDARYLLVHSLFQSGLNPSYIAARIGKTERAVNQIHTNEGKYRRSYIELKWGDVIDADFCHAVYPKYIKIVVSSKVTKATIREAGS